MPERRSFESRPRFYLAALWTVPVGLYVRAQAKTLRCRPAAGSNCRLGARHRSVPHSFAPADPRGRRAGYWVDCAFTARNAVVHPVQCDCWRQRYSDGISRRYATCSAWATWSAGVSCFCQGSFLFDYRAGHRVRRSLECQHCRGILPFPGTDVLHHRTWRGNQPGDGSGNLRLLFAAICLAAMVVTINRLLWRRLYRLASTRFKLES